MDKRLANLFFGPVEKGHHIRVTGMDPILCCQEMQKQSEIKIFQLLLEFLSGAGHGTLFEKVLTGELLVRLKILEGGSKSVRRQESRL